MSFREAVEKRIRERRSSHTPSPEFKEAVTRRVLKVIPELEKPENAKWLALLIDCEGSQSWVRWGVRDVRTPQISLDMSKLESEATVDEGGRLISVKTYSGVKKGMPIKYFAVKYGRAYLAMRYMKPYQVKFRRLSELMTTLFKYRSSVPTRVFDKVIAQLFGRYVDADEANDILLRMRKDEFADFMRKARELTDRYLR